MKVKMTFMILLAIPVLAIVLGQFGLFSSSAPADLGIHDGKLKPPSKSSNSVSSQAYLYKNTEYDAEYAQMTALPIANSATDSFSKIKTILSLYSEATLIEEKPNYLKYEFQTALMKYVDDVEFFLSSEENVIHFRSASRLGRKDFGKNRNRMEDIQAKYLAN